MTTINPLSNDQRDEQLAGVQEDAISAHIDSALKDLHTATIGRIVSFDEAKQTATVQPVIQRIWVNAGVQNLPLLVDCPVEFPAGGGFVLTFPLKPGDEGIVTFTERCLDNWHVNGQLAPPAEYRMHDLSDGVIRVGLRNQTRTIQNFNTEAVELRNDDGSVVISLGTDGSITQTTGAASTVLTSDGRYTVNAPGGIFMNGPQINSGTLDAAGAITGGGVGLGSHTHPMVGIQFGQDTKNTGTGTG